MPPPVGTLISVGGTSNGLDLEGTHRWFSNVSKTQLQLESERRLPQKLLEKPGESSWELRWEGP